MSAVVQKPCKLCHKNPPYTNSDGRVISLYCSNACAKRAGAPLPNPGGLVKRAKHLDLAQLLAQEEQLEKAKDDPVEPQSIVSLVKEGVWKLESKEGTADVLLTRTYNDEVVRVTFHMAELEPFEPDKDSDDEDNDQDGIALQHDDDPNQHDDHFGHHIPTLPVECRISISKPNGGALLFDCYAWTKRLNILKISYIKDSSLVQEDTAEGDKKILASGVGPEFDSLPKRIKEEFKKYLGEREIDDVLAQAIHEFTRYKTQKEALGWFESIQAFVIA